MAHDLGLPLAQLAAEPAIASRIEPARYVGGAVGLPTLRDIVEELKKPGRDPRRQFAVTAFRDDVRELADLQEGMILPGTVTNVAAFGAFVDIGVHQDGLVHISHLAHHYVKDPHQVVKVGDPVKVKVLSVDLPRERIALSLKEADPAGAAQGGGRIQQEQRPTRPAADPAASLAKAGFRVKKS
jgi:uncharacterized protein